MSRSAPDGSPAAGPADDRSVAFRYPSDEWQLLVRLPGRVLTAALAGQGGDPGTRVRAAVAGLEAIAAGRLFDSDLVRIVATAIYAESGGPGRDGAERGEAAGVLRSCRAAVRALGRRADPADSAAYRQWVQSVAVRTSGTGSGFVTDLGRALGLAADG